MTNQRKITLTTEDNQSNNEKTGGKPEAGGRFQGQRRTEAQHKQAVDGSAGMGLSLVFARENPEENG